MAEDIIFPEAYRLHEVCNKLDVSLKTGYRQIAKKRAPFHRAFKVGKDWRIPVVDVAALTGRESQ